ncbi:MAG: cytochrome P450 [Enhygromyxa sp.]
MSSATSHSNLSMPLVASAPATVKAHQQAALPPGPGGSLWPSYQLIFKPLQAIPAWRERFGPTFTVNRLGIPTVITGDPELIAQIYAAKDPDLYAAAVPEPADVLLGAGSLLLRSGEAHKNERKLMMPPFHGERMRAWAEAIAAAGRRAFARRGNARALDLTQQAALEVIIRVIFGVDDEARVRTFADAVLAMTEATRAGFLFSRSLQRDVFGVSPYARFRRAVERLDALLFDQIARTRASLDGRTDVLADLLRARYDDGSSMDDATIRDHLRTLLFAGHETTAVILAWAIYFVHRDPDVLARVRTELETLGPDAGAESLTRLPYLAAVIDETLRIRPISADTVRLLTKPWRLGPWQLEANMAVSAAPLIAHFDPALWPEPHAFRPERFLDEHPRPNVYLPFGGGARRCLGATFARFEASVLLGTLLREHEVELLEREVEWVRAPTTLQPGSGVRIRVDG